LKRNTRHIFRTWVLLFCFVTGQCIVYAHQHAGESSIPKTACQKQETLPKQTVTENCRLCDAMQHNQMMVSGQVHFAPVTVTAYTYKTIKYRFISIALILSAGRSPPLAAYSC
jgi:hypothetical protein